MKRILTQYLPLIAFVLVALSIQLISRSVSHWLLWASTVFGVFPLVLDILATLRRKRVDLGLPVVVTIGILLYLNQAKLAAIFVLLILSGRLFREYILLRVRRSVAEISESLPDRATIKRGGELVEVHISEIQRDDLVAVKAGGRVPVDGILISELGSMDESVVTGESKAVMKKTGDHLIAAAINLGGYIEMKAADTSSNSTVAQMQRLVEEAQSRNAPLSKFTTRYAEWSSIIAVIAVGTVYRLTGNVEKSLALWIALVPVIFAIVVPVATTIGISLLAKSGVLVKSAEALENLTRVDTLCFDKTGTLTLGKPSIAGLAQAGRYDESSFLRYAASIERYSEHSLGEPILEEAKKRGLPLEDATSVQIVKGEGVSGLVGARAVSVGNVAFLKRRGILLGPEALERIEAQEESGATPILVGIDGELGGMIFLRDLPRPETQSTLAELRAQGYRLVMLTGDQPKVAEKIGREIGVTKVEAALLPEGKIDFIVQAKKRGRKVLMVGDGINDAPALSEANVGVAMGLKGIGITLEAAEVVLVKDQLGILPSMLVRAKKTFSVIRADLVLATGIHLIAAILVLFGVIGILGSTLIHQLSSALVLLNTARLFSA